MTIRFFNVGQGDSVALEWKDDSGNPRIGLIDCNLNGSQNVVVEHLKAREYSRIDFFVLSHPHRDHFSGIVQLLNFCKNSDIVIERFYHTCNVTAAFIKACCKSPAAYKDAGEIFILAAELYKARVIQQIVPRLGQPLPISLPGGVTILCFSPGQEEDVKFNAYRDRSRPLDEVPDASAAGNLLSPFFLVEFDGCVALLMADAERATQVRIEKMLRKQQLLDGKETVLVQISHHGSSYNYCKTLLSLAKPKNAVISCGWGNQHGHPHQKVLTSLKSAGLTIHRTDGAVGAGLKSVAHSQALEDMKLLGADSVPRGRDVVIPLRRA